jgi:hypothetical protein
MSFCTNMNTSLANLRRRDLQMRRRVFFSPVLLFHLQGMTLLPDLSFFKISCHRYLATRRPNTLITYTFFPQTIPANSMIMKPPSYVKNPHPSYYISVSMNCFTPSSYITTIRRDGWEGEMIGDFEYGINEGPMTY